MCKVHMQTCMHTLHTHTHPEILADQHVAVPVETISLVESGSLHGGVPDTYRKGSYLHILLACDFIKSNLLILKWRQ